MTTVGVTVQGMRLDGEVRVVYPYKVLEIADPRATGPTWDRGGAAPELAEARSGKGLR